jgi:hypothetical protein
MGDAAEFFRLRIAQGDQLVEDVRVIAPDTSTISG